MSPDFALPTYLVVISFTYCLCIYWVYKRANEFKRDVSTALDICLMIMLGGLLGGRFFHVFYENFAHYQASPVEILKVWQGGFVFYGGFFGALLFTLVFLWQKHKKKNLKKLFSQYFYEWADFFAPVLALGYALGRVACFLNGCCHGTTCALPWAVAGKHPTQLYATFYEFLVLWFLLWREREFNSKNLFLYWLGLHAIGRLVMEHFRSDYRGDLLLGLSISSWISWVILVSVFIMVRRTFMRTRALKNGDQK